MIARRKATRAGTCIKLPDNISLERACANIKNTNHCLIYCFKVQKYYHTINGKDKNQVYHYKKHFDEIIEPKDTIYPIDIQHNISKFEKINNIKINVFQYDKKNY